MLDPASSSPAFSNTLDWIAAVMTGTLATAIATLVIAAIGIAMLQGRLAAREAAKAILGCFIVFGAPYIAQALAGVSQETLSQNAGPSPVYVAPSQPMPPHLPSIPLDKDPYAGASVPTQTH